MGVVVGYPNHSHLSLINPPPFVAAPPTEYRRYEKSWNEQGDGWAIIRQFHHLSAVESHPWPINNSFSERNKINATHFIALHHPTYAAVVFSCKYNEKASKTDFDMVDLIYHGAKASPPNNGASTKTSSQVNHCFWKLQKFVKRNKSQNTLFSFN